jgi:hypothetical protein
MNMPRVENFLPRKEQLEPVLNAKKNGYFTGKGHESPQHQNKVAFRRNKYSKAEVKL